MGQPPATRRLSLLAFQSLGGSAPSGEGVAPHPCQQFLHLLADLVTHSPELVRRHPLRHGDVPFLAALGLEAGATSVAHRHGHVVFDIRYVQQPFGNVLSQVVAE